MTAAIQIVRGDLLDQRVEVIVNAWNRNFIPWWLLIPQGVSGAIKRRGGYQPFRELRRVGVMRAGQAALTSAGRLPLRGIIHVAALDALWRSSETIVRDCVDNALAIAAEQRFRSIAFPLIGSGTGGLSRDRVLSVVIEQARLATFDGEIVIVTYGG